MKKLSKFTTFLFLILLSFSSITMAQRKGWGPGNNPSVNKDSGHMPVITLEGGKNYKYCFKFRTPNNKKFRYYVIIYSDKESADSVFLKRDNYTLDICHSFEKVAERTQDIYVTLWRDRLGNDKWKQRRMRDKTFPDGSEPQECNCNSSVLRGSGNLNRVKVVRRKLTASSNSSDATIIIMEK